MLFMLRCAYYRFLHQLVIETGEAHVFHPDVRTPYHLGAELRELETPQVALPMAKLRVVSFSRSLLSSQSAEIS